MPPRRPGPSPPLRTSAGRIWRAIFEIMQFTTISNIGILVATEILESEAGEPKFQLDFLCMTAGHSKIDAGGTCDTFFYTLTISSGVSGLPRFQNSGFFGILVNQKKNRSWFSRSSYLETVVRSTTPPKHRSARLLVRSQSSIS